MFDNFWKKG